MLKNDGMRPIVRHQPTFAIRMAIGVTMLVIRKVPRLRFYGQRLLQNPIVRTISVQRIMETGAVADIQEISIMKKGSGKSPNAVFIALTVVSVLLVTANSYAEDITVSETITNHLSASPKETFFVVEDFVRNGKTGQKFILKHGQCKGQDCKWGAHRTERRLKAKHASSKKVGNEVFYGLSIYIPENFGYEFTAGKMSLFQAKMTGVDMPLWMLDTDGAGYYLKLPHSRSVKCTIGFIEKGRWHDFVVKADYGREQVKGHKYFEIWQNGERQDCDSSTPIVTNKVMGESRSHGWNSNKQEITMRYGIYKWEIGDFLKFTGSKKPEVKTFIQPNGYTNIKFPFKYDWGKELMTTVMYYDEVRIGKSLEEASIQDDAVD